MKFQVTFRNCDQIWDSPFGVVGSGKLSFTLHVSGPVGAGVAARYLLGREYLAGVLGSVCGNWNAEKLRPDLGFAILTRKLFFIQHRRRLVDDRSCRVVVQGRVPRRALGRTLSSVCD